MITFQIVTIEKFKQLAELANIIWHEYWTEILSPEQIDYMVDKFQSENAIINQYKNENYTYYFITLNKENIGYFGISEKQYFLFLSKFYIKKDFRHNRFGTKAFELIKKIAKDKNYKSIKLTVNKYNKNTIQIYLKWGFKIVDSVITNIGNDFVMDDYIMEYIVSPE